MVLTWTPWTFFLWNLLKWTWRIGPSSSRTRITFSLLGSPPQPLLLSHMWMCGDIPKGDLGCRSSFVAHRFTQSELYSGLCRGAHKMDASRCSPGLGSIPGRLLCFTPGGVRGKDKLNKGLDGKQLKINWDAIRSAPVHLHPTSVVEPGGMSTAPASVRDRLSPTREGKLRWKVCLHPHLEQGGTPLGERSHGCGCRFFLSYRWELAVFRTTPLNCIFKNWDMFDSQNLKKDMPALFL